MTTLRRQHRGECEAKVVLEALRGERTLHAIAADSGVHPLQITQGKQVALEGLPTLLSRRRGTKPREEAALQAAFVPADRAVKSRAGLAEKHVGPLDWHVVTVNGRGRSAPWICCCANEKARKQWTKPSLTTSDVFSR